tara:strand:- start:205 stop:612 length:408 start_codon:yes stop_codon:yes gene_type:complete
MRKRQSSKRKVRNANSQRKEDPVDVFGDGICFTPHARKIKRKKTLRTIFLTKKFRPRLALILTNEIAILKQEHEGIFFGHKEDTANVRLMRDSIETDIRLLSRNNKSESIFNQFKKEKEAYLKGLIRSATFYKNI